MKSSPRTPIRRKPRKAAARDTPIKLANRNKSDVETEDSSDNDDTSGDECQTPQDTPSKRQTPLKSKTNILKNDVEDYFLQHSSTDSKAKKRSVKTSDRTLAKLGDSRPDPVTIKYLLSNMTKRYHLETSQLRNNYVTQFPRWIMELREGYNIVLYGLGSKRQLLTEFRETCLSNAECMEVPGYQSNITIRQVLNTICSKFLDCGESFKSLQDQAKYISQRYSNTATAPLFILIHNIDGLQFRSEKTQSLLSIVADTASIYLVATVDHINAAMLWSQSHISRFNWIWKNCTTLIGYEEETYHENSLLAQNSGSLALSSLRHVMASLTQNAKNIFLLIAKYQIEGGNDPGYQGISVDDLYWRCRDALLVNSDVTLRAQLTEFKDHKLIRIKKGMDGHELIIVLLDNSNLQEFVQNFDDYQ